MMMARKPPEATTGCQDPAQLHEVVVHLRELDLGRRKVLLARDEGKVLVGRSG